MAVDPLRHPSRLVVGSFAAAIGIGTLLLSLPASRRDGVHVSLVDRFFTSTSAVCVTGLATVDTGTTWSVFGKVVLMVLAQVGGLGIMTVAALVAIALSRRLSMRTRRLTMVQAGTLQPGDLRAVLRGVLLFAVAFEVVITVVLGLRFASAYDMGLVAGMGNGAFTAVMAFNNAGFGLRPDNLTPYVSDWIVNLPVMVGVVAGGLGFPVLVELLDRRRAGYRWYRRRERRAARPQRLSLHTRLTLAMTVLLLGLGFLMFAALEWTNPGTLGPLSLPTKLLASGFQSVSTRTAGFNTVSIGAMHETTWLCTDVLMFIGAGSAGTGGGLKVTTVAVLALMSVAVIRGDDSITFHGRSIPNAVLRQAVAVTLVAIAVTGGVTLFILAGNAVGLSRALFEAVSAFGTVGLSTGITSTLGTQTKMVLAGLMFFGRLGPLTLGFAFIARTSSRRYQFPEERPLVG
jgi:trk system potassium uptake protein